MDRGAWRATVHWAAKSQTQLKQLGMHRCVSVCVCVCDQTETGIVVYYSKELDMTLLVFVKLLLVRWTRKTKQEEALEARCNGVMR